MAQISITHRSQVINQQSTVKKINFIHSFHPIYIFSRMFGLMPFSIVYYPNGDVEKPKVSILDAIWFAILLSIYVFGFSVVLSFVIDEPPDSTMSWITTIVFTLSSESSLIFCCLSSIANMGNRFKLIDILKMFIIFDQEASRTKVSFIHFTLQN